MTHDSDYDSDAMTMTLTHCDDYGSGHDFD